MTLNEFRVWFEGFCEGLEGAPTAEQFAKLGEKIAMLRMDPVPYVAPLQIDPNYTPAVKFIPPSTPCTGTPMSPRLPEVWCRIVNNPGAPHHLP